MHFFTDILVSVSVFADYTDNTDYWSNTKIHTILNQYLEKDISPNKDKIIKYHQIPKISVACLYLRNSEKTLRHFFSWFLII